jgi:hypothetical protein
MTHLVGSSTGNHRQAKTKKQIAPESQAMIMRADRRNHSGNSRNTNPEIPIEISSLGRATKTLSNLGLEIDKRTKFLGYI